MDSIFFDLVVPEIFCFKHDVGAFNVIIFFFGNPDVDSFSVVSYAIPVPRKAKSLLGYCIESVHCAQISLILSEQQIRTGKNSTLFGSQAISVKIKLSDTFQSKSYSILAIRVLLLGHKVQNYTSQ